MAILQYENIKVYKYELRLQIITVGFGGHDITVEDFFGILGLDVLIVQTVHGLTIYERQFNSTTKDSGLISGFMNALSSMFEVLSGEGSGFQTYEAEGSLITLHRLQKSDIILISEQELPSGLTKKFTHAHELIETELSDNFFDNEQGTDIPDEEIIEELFEQADIPISYLWPYMVNTDQMEKVFRMPLGDSKYLFYLNLIEEFNISEAKQELFLMRQLCHFLEKNKIFRREIARCVDFYISYGVITKQPTIN